MWLPAAHYLLLAIVHYVANSKSCGHLLRMRKNSTAKIVKSPIRFSDTRIGASVPLGLDGSKGRMKIASGLVIGWSRAGY